MLHVATNSMLAAGGHNYQTFREGKDVRERGIQYEMIRDWITAHSPVSAPDDARIVRAAERSNQSD